MTVLAAAGVAILVLLTGNLPWAGFGPISGLGALNLRLGTTVPWAIVPMSLYLWAYWRFIGGKWGASTAAATRQANLRANSLPARVWGAALAAGVLGFGTLLALLTVVARLVNLPSSFPIVMPPEMPVVTSFLLLAMQSVVAGVSEESAFRGYMQSMIEREHGLALAILANGTLFGLLHFGNHPGDVLLMLPYYISVSAVYGGLTWAADSILPALVLHSVADIVVLTRWWITGRPEWQVTQTQSPLISQSGVDMSFIGAAIASVALGLLTIWAYGAVRRLRMSTTASALPATDGAR